MRIESRLLGGMDRDLACGCLVWHEDGTAAVFASQTTVAPYETPTRLDLCLSALVDGEASIAARDDRQ